MGMLVGDGFPESEKQLNQVKSVSRPRLSLIPRVGPGHDESGLFGAARYVGLLGPRFRGDERGGLVRPAFVRMSPEEATF
jgi:hypothetical protein